MAIGLGKRYFVEIIKYKFGSLEECLEFINLNKDLTKNGDCWFELSPLPKFKKGTNKIIKCDEYRCTLVKEDK